MKPKLLLFDLGGVIIEVDTTGLRALGETGKSDVDLWETWLTCAAVQEYESGKISNAAFAEGVLKAFNSAMPTEEFLRSFTAWPTGIYAGVPDLLRELRQSYKLGYLSNSNALHYPRFEREFDINCYFDYPFASFQMGRVKPHADIFEAVLAALPYKPADIFFVDDNRLNVEMARSLGMRAEIVRGPLELRAVLTRNGIYTP
ncbi:MAG: HAD family phosphatase [Turneriella sp.]